ncbi:MAG: DNA-directed RNA polymerase subunit beta [Candidatus Eisenbacteria bacterium]|nr:DNA-directed RNA polymerase subunit beta [Candidatus Eisenbacteria bacterium]
MKLKRKERTSFSTSEDIQLVEVPNLLDIQLESFKSFLQAKVDPSRRDNVGLQEVFNNIFPIADTREMYSLEFVSYDLGEPKYSVEECQERDLTFSVPLKATLRLRIKEVAGGEKRDKEIMEQEVYLGELPMITRNGTFIINGAERVIVSQLHRSPGVFFEEATHPSGKKLYSARIIPYRGSWVEFSVDANDIMYFHIDKKRKQPIAILLKALGYVSDKEILELFYDVKRAEISSSKAKRQELAGLISAENVVRKDTGEVVLEANEELTEARLDELRKSGNTHIKYFEIPARDEVDMIRNTLRKDTTRTQEDALSRIYCLIRPGETPRPDTARDIVKKLFFNPKRYDLAKVGRYKLNQKLLHESILGDKLRKKSLGLEPPSDDKNTLCKEDFISIIKYLMLLRLSGSIRVGGEEILATTDDIDHLGNRRVRSVGELLANQFNIGLARMARIIRERMSLQEPEAMTPADLVNARTISAVIQSFFGSSQLSQFMDQTNPLAELTHKRRLSALGPGGLSRDRAGFEVRDVHYTHYGRICPIETPEGPNIGLISSLSTYARVNELGFLETPYWKVKNGAVDKKELVFLSADEEDRHRIAQANAPLDKRGKLLLDRNPVRYRGEFPEVAPDEVEFMDVSPMQLVSPAAALIPFLEHDDANRALMGSNMQRQAVPLLVPEPPLIGTGLEEKVAEDSGALIISSTSGVVESVSGDMIVIRPDGVKEGSDFGDMEIYNLLKFKRSNQDTSINQRPLVKEGETVRRGQVIADGAATRDGELALGTNTLVAFMPWGGYNFEDAILVSERLLKGDKFTSVHIEEFELQVRDTKRGVEEVTREIPNVSEDVTKNLDEEGIVMIGAKVKAGDILVGKVTPKGEIEHSPEERLLRAIFGEKAGDVRDASLKAPPGMDGIVTEIKVFSRREKNESSKKQEKKEMERLKRLTRKEKQRVVEIRNRELADILAGRTARKVISARTGRTVIQEGRKITPQLIDKIEFAELAWGTPIVRDSRTNEKIWDRIQSALASMERVEKQLEKDIEKVQRGDELPPGVVKLVKVFVAKKRKLSVGDKIAGRHGNKGVVAKILPEEDMPYLADGTDVDIVLNPLGVPSRMNLGQVLETHLGWAAEKLGMKVSSPVFAGATVDMIKATLKDAELPEDGKAVLYDGRTGDPFDHRVTVGFIYTMKLSHLVDDKMHARSIGPYSLVTQQPLGGKAQFGGQRFGEMEVWALEAYGAAYTLQELLTVKSDDVSGRSRIYEAIVKGENPPEPGIPESFNVLVKELQGLCLDVQFEGN